MVALGHQQLKAGQPDGVDADGVDADGAEWSARLGLAVLDSMYPRRLSAVLKSHSAIEALALLRSGGALRPEARIDPAAQRRLAAEARKCDVDSVIALCESTGISVVMRGEGSYPARLASDPEAPEVIFVRGDIGLCERRAVAIVGTRRATAAGRATAAELGRELAERGIAIVSGLASGIDAASQRDLDAVPGAAAIAVVGSGLDVPYPRSNEVLWERIAARGVLISEWAPGAAPEAWHFPLRNRIIAALAEVVVVVESRETGGSLITARAALDRGVDVMAVPGSVHCRAAAGTNQLIADGAGVVCSVDDVVTALALSSATSVRPAKDGDAEPSIGRFGPIAVAIYRHCRERPRTLDQLADSIEANLIDVARAVVQLEHHDLLADSNGWFEALGSRLLSAGEGSG